MRSGVLTIIPTPLHWELGIAQETLDLLNSAALNPSSKILVEEPKLSRRRWLRWGLPRQSIEEFVYYNEHSQAELNDKLITHLKKGHDVILMTDGGLPGFCDPGSKLISKCHNEKIKVTATASDNSVALAFALSGFITDEYTFKGFPPREKSARNAWLRSFCKSSNTVIMMDTAYRLKKTLLEVLEIDTNSQYFLAMDLNRESEKLLRGTMSQIIKALKDSKKDFVLIKQR